jgi:hypothetical protein
MSLADNILEKNRADEATFALNDMNIAVDKLESLIKEIRDSLEFVLKHDETGKMVKQASKHLDNINRERLALVKISRNPPKYKF